VIYFIQPTGGGPIKIGTTENLEQRLKGLDAAFGTEWALLATMPGSYEEERALHQRFRHLALGRELFRPARELLEFIGKPLLASPDPEAVEGVRPIWKTVDVEASVVMKARMVAASRGIAVMEYLSDVLRPLVREDLATEAARRLKGDG
jgi:hypothetical protein